MEKIVVTYSCVDNKIKEEANACWYISGLFLIAGIISDTWYIEYPSFLFSILLIITAIWVESKRPKLKV